MYPISMQQKLRWARPEVIKLEYSLKLKIKGNNWVLVRKQPIIALYFEFEYELNF